MSGSTLLSAETAYLFRHAVLRDAAYELQLPADRAKLHLLIVELVELLFRPAQVDEVLLELADHLSRARLQTGDQSHAARECHYTRRAADRAEKKYQGREAETLWLRLIEISDGAERVDAFYRAGGVAYYAGERTLALTRFDQSRQLGAECGDIEGEGNACSMIGSVHTDLGNMDEAEQAFARAEEILAELPTATFEFAMRANQVTLHKRQGNLEAADTAAQRVLELARENRDPGKEAGALLHIAGNHQARGKLAESETALRECIRLRELAGDLRGLAYATSNLGMLCAFTGRQDQAETLYNDAIHVSVEIGESLCAASARGNLAFLMTELKRFDEADKMFQLAVQGHTESGDRQAGAVVLCDMALMQLARGDANAPTTWQIGITELNTLGAVTSLSQCKATMNDFCQRFGLESLP